MRPLASTYEETCGDPTAEVDERNLRCAAVAPHLSLAVIKLDRTCEAPDPAIAGRILDIGGVTQVRVDSPRNTIHVLYDGTRETARKVHRLLVLEAWRETDLRRHGKRVHRGQYREEG
jgi:hypothetical protein